MRPQGFLLIAIALPNIVLGAFILLRNVRDKVNVFFSALAFSVGLWSLGLAGFIFSTNETAALHWAQLYYSAAAVIAVAFAYFSYFYTGRIKSLGWRAAVFMTPMLALISAILVHPQFLLMDIQYHPWGKEVTLNKPGYVLYGVYFCLYVFAGFQAVYQKLRVSRGVQRLYLRYIFGGLVIAFSLGATFNLFYPFFGNYEYIWAGPLFTLAYISMVSYAIIKHRLFDIRLIVVRSLAYVLSISFISILYGIVTYTLSTAAFNGVRGTKIEPMLNIALLVAVAVTFAPAKRKFDKVTNGFFYRDAYDAQAFIDELNRVLVANVDIDLLLHDATAVIDKNLKSQFSAVTLRETSYISRRFIGSGEVHFDEHDLEVLKASTTRIHHRVIVTDDIIETDHQLYRVLSKHNIAVLARLVTTLKYETEGIGYLVLGAKKSGNAYSKQDANIIRIVANELVIAIQNALRFEEIENFNITLQQKVDDATKQLKRTNDKLKSLDETKDEFISMASHQLRTPLTSVKGYLSMVIEGDAGTLNEMQQKLLGQAFTSSQRMVYLIADLLNLSRLRTGKFVIEASPVNLATVIAGELDQLQEALTAKNMELVYEQPKDFPTLMMDETKIRQVLMNFIDNAIYYTPPGGHIVVSLQNKKDTIEFTVKDDGIGVPKSEQHHLFNKFYRAENARKARPDGTGLGLFMAKKVVISSGGAIIFESKEGKGSTFGFTFSKKKLAVPDHAPSQQPEASVK